MHRQIWSCYSKTLWGDAFSRKYIIWPLTLTLGSRSHETSPSTLDNMWPMHRQNLKLLLRKIYEEMHLQEFFFLTFDLDLGVKVTRNVTQYPLGHVIYAPTKFEVATSNGLVEYKLQETWRTDRQTHGRTTDQLWYEINIPYFSYEKAGIITDSLYKHLCLLVWICNDIDFVFVGLWMYPPESHKWMRKNAVLKWMLGSPPKQLQYQRLNS